MDPIHLTGRLVDLRDVRTCDIPDAVGIVGDDRVTHWLSFDARDQGQTAAMIESAISRAQHQPRTEYYLAVIDKQDRMIGFGRLGLDGVHAAKLGYAIHADHWGHGYATDAARTLITYGIGPLGLHRVTAAIGPDDAASIVVAKRLGMTYEGRLRDHVHTNGACETPCSTPSSPQSGHRRPISRSHPRRSRRPTRPCPRGVPTAQRGPGGTVALSGV